MLIDLNLFLAIFIFDLDFFVSIVIFAHDICPRSIILIFDLDLWSGSFLAVLIFYLGLCLHPWKGILYNSDCRDPLLHSSQEVRQENWTDQDTYLDQIKSSISCHWVSEPELGWESIFQYKTNEHECAMHNLSLLITHVCKLYHCSCCIPLQMSNSIIHFLPPSSLYDNDVQKF